MAKEENLGPVGTLHKDYRQESRYIIDDAPPRAKRSAFFVITLATLMWWFPLLWSRFLYAPNVGVHGVNTFVWTIGLLWVLISAVVAASVIRAVRAGAYDTLYGKLLTLTGLGALVCATIIGGWATSSLNIATPLGSNFYLFSAVLGFFFLASVFTETIHALRAGSPWGAGYNEASAWRLENSAYFWLWNCFWYAVFYVIFFLYLL